MGSLIHFLRARSARTAPTKLNYQRVVKTPLNEAPESAVYYLLSTLKLVYQAQHGKVTLERLNKESAISAIRDVQSGDLSAFSRTVDPRGLKQLFYLQVCAVCWERHGNGIRIKALPDAASVRFAELENDRFEAHFHHHHPDLKRDDGITPLLDPVKEDLPIPKTVLNSLESFFTELNMCNKRCLQQFGQQRLLAPDNFSEIFTQHEQKQLSPFLQSLHAATAP